MSAVMRLASLMAHTFQIKVLLEGMFRGIYAVEIYQNGLSGRNACNGHFILGARKPSQIMSQGLQLHRDQMKSERPLNLSLVTKASSEEVRNFSI